MERKRQGFFFFRAIYDSVSQLKKREKAQIYEAIFAYALDGEMPDTEGWSDTARAIWTLSKPMLDSDLRRFENGCKGGAPKGNSNARKEDSEKITEKQPKNNQKQPTNNKNKKQEQETRIENNSLSISPSHKVDEREVAEASSAERERILEIFFFRNFVNPAKEVVRFYAHYEAQGWRRAGGVPITDKVALAQSWKPESDQKRFAPSIADMLAQWYNVSSPRLRHLLLTDLVEASVADGTVVMRLGNTLRNEIEANVPILAPIFLNTHKNHKLIYRLTS